jgi:hypothetical protein
MTLTEDDLRDLLAGHVQRQPENGGRLPEVHRRIAVARRRRRATASGALALAVAGIVLAVALPGSTHRAGVEPTAPTTPYPTYADGGRALGGGRIETGGSGTFSYSFTPTSYDLFLTATCARLTTVTITVNGHRSLDGSCDSGVTGSGNPADDQASRTQWSAMGVVLDQPNAVTVTVSATPGSSAAGIAVTSAIYQAVPFDDYPLPPKPSGQLTALSGDGVIVRPTTPSANGTFDGTFTAQDGHMITVGAIGPGLVDVAIDGHHLQTVGFFTWTQNGYGFDTSPATLATFGIHVSAGQTVTISATATHFTGPYWQISER